MYKIRNKLDLSYYTFFLCFNNAYMQFEFFSLKVDFAYHIIYIFEKFGCNTCIGIRSMRIFRLVVNYIDAE
jgi:hypothetical protein